MQRDDHLIIIADCEDLCNRFYNFFTNCCNTRAETLSDVGYFRQQLISLIGGKFGSIAIRQIEAVCLI